MRISTYSRVALLLVAAAFSIEGYSAEPRRAWQQRPVVKQVSTAPAGIRLTPARKEIIADQPEGTLHEKQRRSTLYYYYGVEGQDIYEAEWSLGEWVDDADGNVYIKNPFAGLVTSSYLKLDKLNGDTLVAHLPQTIYETDEQELYAARMVEQEEDGVVNYVASEDQTDLLFTRSGDTLRALFNTVDDQGCPTEMLGLADAEGNWYGFGDAKIVIEPMSLQRTLLPGGATPQDYEMTYATGDESTYSVLVQAAFSNGKVYLKSPMTSEQDPDQWIEGEITADGKAVFKPQYIGTDVITYNHVFFMPATCESVYNEESETTYYEYDVASQLTFAYDADARTLTAEKGTALLVNTEPTLLDVLQGYPEPVYTPFEETAATPASPVWMSVTDYDADYQYGELYFTVPAKDTEGKFINPEKLTYSVYFDSEEPFTFTTDEYVKLPETTTEIASDYADGYDFFITDDAHEVYVFSPFERVGVQSIYRGGGEERRSPIIWYQDPDGISKTGIAEENTATSYYDLAGRRLSKPQRGITIVRTAGSCHKVIVKK